MDEYKPLSSDEEKLLTVAYMQHPDRPTKGVSEEDFATVIRWGNNLQALADLYSETLRLVLTGDLTLDVKEGVVFLSNPLDSTEKLSFVEATVAAGIIPNTAIDPNLVGRVD